MIQDARKTCYDLITGGLHSGKEVTSVRARG